MFFYCTYVRNDGTFYWRILIVMLVSCRKVRQAERYNWAATRGVNEEMLLENLPEDLQREIRRHLFKFVKKVSVWSIAARYKINGFFFPSNKHVYTHSRRTHFECMTYLCTKYFLVDIYMDSRKPNPKLSKILIGSNICPHGWAYHRCHLREAKAKDIHQRQQNFVPRRSNRQDDLRRSWKNGEQCRQCNFRSLIRKGCLRRGTSHLVSWALLGKQRYRLDLCYNRC